MARGHLVVPVIVLVGLACRPQERAFAPEVPEIPPLPLGLEADLLEIPSGNPITPEKVALGWQLFYDPRLSSDETVSCSSCHLSVAGFADSLPRSVGVGGAVGLRNAPTPINAAFNASQFWDGRAPTLEDQVLGPIQNPLEMANTVEGLEARLNDIPGYRRQVMIIFGAESITVALVAQAIASFERILLSGNSPWDRWKHEDDRTAVSDAAKRGEELFQNKAKCAECHTGSNYTDADRGLFHNIGVGMSDADPDLGRYNVTGREEDRGAFKTPALRNIAETAPYMHDGSMATLEEVIDFYERGGEPNHWLDPEMRPINNFTDQEKRDLLAFLHALTGEVPEWAKRAPRLPPETRQSPEGR